MTHMKSARKDKHARYLYSYTKHACFFIFAPLQANVPDKRARSVQQSDM